MQAISSLLAAGLARHDRAELIDLPGVAHGELLSNLHDLSRINALGGTWLSRWALEQFVQSVQKQAVQRPERFVQPLCLRMLDIGCGLGDIPRSLATTADGQTLMLKVIATDISPRIVHMAQAADPLFRLTYAASDGLRLPFADRSVELVHCSFTLHHFAPAQAVALLGEMRRVAQVGLIVNDIVRSWPGVAGAWLLGRLVSHNRLTRHDGLASARRAYTHAELRELAARAGLGVLAARELPGYRVVLALR